MNLRAWAVVLICAAIAVAVAYRAWNTPERQIRRMLDEIAAVLSHDRPVSGLSAAAAASSLQPYLAPEVIVDAGGALGPMRGRADVVASAARVRVAVPVMLLEFVDVQVTVSSPSSASVHATVKITTRDPSGADLVDAREVLAALTTLEGRWVVTRVETVSVLERVA